MTKSSIEIKCSNCGVWNTGQTHCKSCYQLISQKEIQKERLLENKNKESKLDRKDELEKSLEHLKNHRFLVVRVCFSIIYSTVWLFWVISGVFSMVVAFLSA